MGFFAKLFGSTQVKRPSKAPLDTHIQITTAFSSHYDNVVQKTSGTLPAIPISALDGYISPSGGFVNYGRFRVIGKNPATNRKNKRVYEVRNEDEARSHAESSGLVGPFEVSVLPSKPPSESQLSYAKSLGASIPDGACSHDVSAIISRITDNDESPVTEKLAHKAHIFGLKLSRYSGSKSINALASQLPPSEYLEFLSQ